MSKENRQILIHSTENSDSRRSDTENDYNNYYGTDENRKGDKHDTDRNHKHRH